MGKSKIIDIDRGWDGLVKKLGDIDESFTKVGIVGDKAGEKEKGSTVTVVEIGLIHEFGAEVEAKNGNIFEIPERSFIRSAIDNKEKEIADYQTRIANGVYKAKKLSVKHGLGILGETVKVFIQAGIRAKIPPPLADSTKAKRKKPPPGRESKGEPTPLYDTGQLINSISHIEEINED